MEKNAKIYIAGHNGLVGSALLRQLTKNGYTNIVTVDREMLDLTSRVDVGAFFQ